MARENRAARIAAEYGVSVKQVYRDAHFAEAVDAIADKLGPEARAEILTGSFNRRIRQDQWTELAGMAHAAIASILARMRAGERYRDVASTDKLSNRWLAGRLVQ